jgi:hypothetical protein
MSPARLGPEIDCAGEGQQQTASRKVTLNLGLFIHRSYCCVNCLTVGMILIKFSIGCARFFSVRRIFRCLLGSLRR